MKKIGNKSILTKNIAKNVSTCIVELTTKCNKKTAPKKNMKKAISIY